VGSSELEPHELQDLADNVQKILEVKAQTGVPVRFHLRIEVGETGRTDSDEAAARINAVLKEIREDFRIGQ
jgi:hypothetical protein